MAHESIFSDLNNLKVMSFASSTYARDFGFTQGEVDAALEEFELTDARNVIRHEHHVVLEFKVRNARREASLDDTVAAAHEQIERMGYATELAEQGVPAEHIYAYGLAFEGKHVLVG